MDALTVEFGSDEIAVGGTTKSERESSLERALLLLLFADDMDVLTVEFGSEAIAVGGTTKSERESSVERALLLLLFADDMDVLTVEFGSDEIAVGGTARSVRGSSVKTAIGSSVETALLFLRSAEDMDVVTVEFGSIAMAEDRRFTIEDPFALTGFSFSLALGKIPFGVSFCIPVSERKASMVLTLPCEIEDDRVGRLVDVVTEWETSSGDFGGKPRGKSSCVVCLLVRPPTRFVDRGFSLVLDVDCIVCSQTNLVDSRSIKSMSRNLRFSVSLFNFQRSLCTIFCLSQAKAQIQLSVYSQHEPTHIGA